MALTKELSSNQSPYSDTEAESTISGPFSDFLPDQNVLVLFQHASHVKGFSPVWIFMWQAKYPFSETHFPMSQVKGFSPVWILVKF